MSEEVETKTLLKPHQKEGVDWLIQRKAGILADDMGLGKTLQIIVLVTALLKRAQKDGNRNARALILSPRTLVLHWMKEFRKHLREDDLPTVGSKPAANPQPQVLVCTYDEIRQSKSENKNPHLFLEQYTVMVLDEAHLVRNGKNLTFTSVNSINAEYRYCVSGTPFNNHLDDICTLCRFLRVEPYNSRSWWKQNKERRQMIAQWKKTMFLRREKEILGLVPIEHETVLVPFSKEERTVYEEVLRRLVETYDEARGNLPEDLCKQDLDLLQAETEAAKEGGRPVPPAGGDTFGGKLYKEQVTGLLYLTLVLRLWCCHPNLALPNSKTPSSKTRYLRRRIEDLLLTACLRAFPDWRSRVKRETEEGKREAPLGGTPEESGEWQRRLELQLATRYLKDSRHQKERLLICRHFPKVVIFSQWLRYLNLIQKEILEELGLPFLRLDGSMTAVQRDRAVTLFQKEEAEEATPPSQEESPREAFERRTYGRGSALGSGRLANDRQPFSGNLSVLSKSWGVYPSLSSDEDSFSSTSQGTDSTQPTSPRENEGEVSSQSPFSEDQEEQLSSPSFPYPCSNPCLPASSPSLFSPEEPPRKRVRTQLYPMRDLLFTGLSQRRLPQKAGVARNPCPASRRFSSSGLEQTMIGKEKDPEPCFKEASLTSASSPDLTSRKRKRHPTNAQKKRKEAAETRDGEIYPIFLATTAAGGVGLTLTAAEYVMLMDYWYNPFADLQAMNRVHRLGQKKTVKAVRFEIQDSIESHIRELQLYKENLARKLLQDPRSSLKGKGTSDPRLERVPQGCPPCGELKLDSLAKDEEGSLALSEDDLWPRWKTLPGSTSDPIPASSSKPNHPETSSSYTSPTWASLKPGSNDRSLRRSSSDVKLSLIELGRLLIRGKEKGR